MPELTDPLTAVVDDKSIPHLGKLGITTVGELLYYPPRKYVVRGGLSGDAAEPKAGEWYSIIGRIKRADTRPMRSRRGQLLRVVVDDGTRNFEAAFFNPYGITKFLVPGVRVLLAGEVKEFQGTLNLSHPQWIVLEDLHGQPGKGSPMMMQMLAAEEQAAKQRSEAGEAAPAQSNSRFERGIMPLYPANSSIQTWDIWAAVRAALAVYPAPDDVLTAEQRSARGLMTISEALHTVHLPDSKDHVDRARERMKFDEALAVQVVLAQRRMVGRDEVAPRCPYVPGKLEDALRGRLPFTLTDGQELVLTEIGEQLAQGEPMSRLLQGEVGSGKTLVALLAMLRVVDNGRQCALLAPTEVLAAQHHRTIKKMLGDLAKGGELTAADDAIVVSLLTGSMRTKGKRQTLLDVVTGSASIVIGTHALLEEHVEFFDLGMVVVDEQHRFGVEQRDVLRGKGRDGMWPHFLVMTATPIPRTVAMTAFGDLDTSVLTELPGGRQPITTNVVPTYREAWMERAWNRAEEEIQAGRQIYVVCSRIGEDPTAPKAKPAATSKTTTKTKTKTKTKSKPKTEEPENQTTSLLEQYEMLLAGPLGRYRIAMLHGRMPADEKNDVMDAFARGEVDILVATTVIEVGVDVPNATMMVIVDAERFGVSQLHQLRGRIGRGSQPSLCLLMTQVGEQSSPMERLRAVEGSTDGFELARIDLLQRREGDVLGRLQSGQTTSLRFLSLLDDVEVIADARELALEIVADDRTLTKHPALGSLVDAVMAPRKAAYLDKS